MNQQPDERFSLRAVGRSALVLVSATMAVQLIGILREIFVAAQVGLSEDLDALIIGIALPVTVASVLTAGLRPAMVPAYMEARAAPGGGGARNLAGTVLLWSVLAGVVVALMLIVLSGPLVAVMGPGLDAESQADASGYLRLVAPSAMALASASVLFAVCQAEEEFAILAVSIITGPACAVLVMFALWDQLGLTALALGSLIGPYVALTVMVVALEIRRLGPRLHIMARGMGLAAFMRHALPLSTSAAILQLNPVIDRALATLIVPGGVGALRFGDSLLRAPISAIDAAWGAAVYPALVKAARDEGDAGLGPSTERTLRFIVALVVPVALIAIAVAPTAVFVVYGRGEFGAEDVEAVSRILAAFAPMMVILMANEVLTSALNARRRGLILLAAGILNVTLNLIFDVVLGIAIGIVGIALSSMLTAAAVTTWKARRFARLEAGVNLRVVAGTAARATAAAAPGAVVIGLWTRWAGLPESTLLGLLELAVSGIVGLGSYVLLSSHLGLREPRSLVDFVAQRFRARLSRRST